MPPEQEEFVDDRFDVELSIKVTNRRTNIATLEMEKFTERDVSAEKTLAVEKGLADMMGARLAEQMKKLKTRGSWVF